MSLRPIALLAFLSLVSAIAPPDSMAARRSAGRWTELPANGIQPDARKHHTMIYDAASSRFILFGGENDTSLFNDVWQLTLGQNVSNWSQLNPSGDAIAGRHGHSATYVPGSPAKMIVYTGRLGQGSAPSFAGDTLWRLTLGGSPSWDYTDSSSGGVMRPRTHSAMSTYNDTTAFLMGGFFPALGEWTLCDAWKMNPPYTAWQHVSGDTALDGNCGTPNHPDRRWKHTMISAGDSLVIYGGLYEDFSTSNAFSFRGTLPWAKHAPPNGYYNREFHASVYDPIDARKLSIGGYWRDSGDPNAYIINADSAALVEMELPASSSPSWSLLDPDGNGPGYIAEGTAVYDPIRDRVIMFGGVNDSGDVRDEVWALEFLVEPEAVSDLTVTVVAKNGLCLSWTSPAEDEDYSTGTVASYDLRYSTSPITEATFSSATPISTGTPQSAGSTEMVTVSGLSTCTTYYFALKSTDSDTVVSAISNVVQQQTACSGPTGAFCEGGLQAREVVGEGATDAREFSLARPSPNPALRSALLEFALPAGLDGARVSIHVLDLSGRRVRTLEEGRMTAGRHRLEWRLDDAAGRRVSPGLYFVRASAADEVRTRSVLVID